MNIVTAEVLRDVVRENGSMTTQEITPAQFFVFSELRNCMWSGIKPGRYEKTTLPMSFYRQPN
jgi:hypothetical protein